MNKLKSIFKTEHPLIGMVHFPPLIGYANYPGFNYIEKKMLKEAEVLERAGFDGIIIENNYDIPHTEKISPMAAAMFGVLVKTLEREIKIPFGLDVLWNDYGTSLSICSSTKAKFFRVPAFVDTVKTTYGIMPARAKEITALRHNLGLDKIGIFADVQVKHSEMVDKRKTLDESAREAVKAGADVIIITGKWTGDAPKSDDLKLTRNTVKKFPILIGSGATTENLSLLKQCTDGVIVGMALKDGGKRHTEVNVKPFTANISPSKALLFVKRFKKEFGK